MSEPAGIILPYAGSTAPEGYLMCDGSAVSRILEIGKNPADLNAEELKDVGSFASTSASLSTEFSGGIPSIRDRETILKRIEG